MIKRNQVKNLVYFEIEKLKFNRKVIKKERT